MDRVWITKLYGGPQDGCLATMRSEKPLPPSVLRIGSRLEFQREPLIHIYHLISCDDQGSIANYQHKRAEYEQGNLSSRSA